MIIKQTIFLLAIVFIGNANAQGTFEIIGTTSTQLEGKKIFISNEKTEYSGIENKILDSCIIKNGSFRFTGSLKNPATYVSLYLRWPDIGVIQFFLESRKINITVANSKRSNLLASCRLQNAPIAAQQKELELAKADYNKKLSKFSKKETEAYATDDDSLRSAIVNESRLLSKEKIDILTDFIKKHPAYYVSLFWFCYELTDKIISQPDSALVLFKHFDPKLQQLPEAQAVLQRMTNKIALAQNRTLPQFSIPDTSGNLIAASEFKNKYLLIDFWASWCGPCIEEIPDVKNLYAQFGNKNLAVLGVSLDSNKDKWLRAVKKYAMPWTQVSELKGWNGSLPKNLDIRYLPQYYLVDPQGKFVLMGASIQEVQKYMQNLDLSKVRDR
ncbi:MAG TPA: TlpA disulfide reductase family protein [Ohtaekwangia sp.]|nr:TlpA disulfide reductase family protein [Ohtaekwangia sp.]